MPSEPSELSRTFIKRRLVHGIGEKAAREAHNALVDLSPTEIEFRWGKAYKGLSGQPKLTPKESHRVYSALSRKERAERTEARRSTRFRTEAMRRQEEYYGREFTGDYQTAQDAGTMYRATHDERYREDFEEGSP